MCPANRSWHDLDGRWMRVQKTERSEDQDWKKNAIDKPVAKRTVLIPSPEVGMC